MKRILLILAALTALAIGANAQTDGQKAGQYQFVTALPGGACSPAQGKTLIVISTGKYYICVGAAWAEYAPGFNGTFSGLSGKPTTLSGYSITDAYPLTGNPAGFLTGNQNITASGDATGSGSTSLPLTLVTVNGSPGSFGAANKSLGATVNGKGLVTSLTEQTIQIAESQVTNLVTDLAAKAAIARALNTGNGLAGGGDLSADRTIDLRLNSGGGLSKLLGVGSNELGVAAGGISNSMLASGIDAAKLTGTLPALDGGALTNLNGANLQATSVTKAKIENIAASRLLGNATGSAAAPTEIPLAGSLAFSGGDLQLSGDSSTPGNSKYYGTDGTSTKGYFSLPSSIPFADNSALVKNNSDKKRGKHEKTFAHTGDTRRFVRRRTRADGWPEGRPISICDVTTWRSLFTGPG